MLLTKRNLGIGIEIPEDLNEAYDEIFEHVGSSSFKKTDFAMSLLATDIAWQTPDYIAEGLQWLENRLHEQTVVA